MIVINDCVIAKKNDKSIIDDLKDLLKKIPTPRPVPAPGNLPYPTPTPDTMPITGPAAQSEPFTIEYTWQNNWPGYDATPVPRSAPSPAEMAVSSLLSEAVISASPASANDGPASADELSYPGKDLRGYIIALLGFGCVCYLVYLGYAMIKK